MDDLSGNGLACGGNIKCESSVMGTQVTCVRVYENGTYMYDGVPVSICCRGLKNIHLLYRVSQEECARLREGVPYVKVYRYNPKHLCPKLNGYGDNGQRKV